ncbi:hypothetical protein PENSPDRAFT_586152 [Peniophora sp. CONT]|nr:hypothetical protein PENSPDRAFT_586152 [Peniophora sp. CONT]
MLDPTYPLIPILNICAAFLLVVTLALNTARGAYNRGVLMLEGWVLVQVLLMAIQSIVWRDSWHNIAPVFCDISSHMWQGLTVGIPACSFVITRRVWYAIQGDSAVDDQKVGAPREMFVDCFIGLGVPLLSMGSYYVVQGARFQVIENYGCSTYVYECGVALIVLQVWLLVFPLMSVSLYGWRIIVFLRRHRRTTNHILQKYDEFGRTRYTRAFALACVDVALVLPLGIVNIVVGSAYGVSFWPGWNTIHEDWDPQFVVREEWRGDRAWSYHLYWNQCTGVVLSIAIFLLFGLTGATRDSCRDIFRRAKSSVSSMTTVTSGSSGSIVPPSTSLSATPCVISLASHTMRANHVRFTGTNLDKQPYHLCRSQHKTMQDK